MNKKRVLVIDDEQIVVDSVRKILTAEDYEVDVSLQGKTGIEMAVDTPYDIVLTDIRMPDIGGLIVLRDIKRKKPALPVLIITGYASVKSAVSAMKLGASDYIEKPFSPAELADAVLAAIDRMKTGNPEPQHIMHKDEMIRVLNLGATDDPFRKSLIRNGADALDDFDLTGPEKLAIITADIAWIEEQIGELKPAQKQWLVARLGAEIW